MGRTEVRGPAARLFDLMKGGVGGNLVREILVQGPAGTGKSRGILEWLWSVATTYHGVRILIVRKTRVSLTEAGMVTLEDQVIPPGHPALEGPHRAHRQQYTIQGTKSEIVMGGMDNPTRLYSTDWDIVYVQEATELLEDEWERLRRGLRHFAIPLQVLIGDSNPDSPGHWLAKRMKDGRTEDWVSRHWDNPKWYSISLKDWTPEGRAYIESLSRLTGVRRRRLLKGEWVSAEGAVWENFDPAVHVIDRPKELSELGIRKYFCSLDWGYTAAGVLQVWGVDGESRIYLVEEYYRAGQNLQWWAEKVHQAYRKWQIMCAVADPARSDSIAVANDFLGNKGCRRLIWPAYNRRRATAGGDMGGLDLVRHKFATQADGRPAIFILRDSLQGRDSGLHELGRPCSLVDEIPSYVYLQSQDGKPSKEQTDPHCEDHACDALRYAACFIWKRDLSDDQLNGKFAPGTFGQLLNHDEVE